MEDREGTRAIIIECFRNQLDELNAKREGMLRVEYESKEVTRMLGRLQNEILRRIGE